MWPGQFFVVKPSSTDRRHHHRHHFGSLASIRYRAVPRALLRRGDGVESNYSPRGDGAMASSTRDKPDVQVIKQSIALRAKYRKGQGPEPWIQTFSPVLAVPHPKNRGGDPVVSKRTKQLSGHITTEGHDPVEASSSAVAVEAHEYRKHPEWGTFQDHFTSQVKGKDPDMADRINGIQAVIGTLSHSHNNCLSRNMSSGQSGCDCGAFSRGDGATKCTCLCKAILNDKGCYCLVLVRARDVTWAEHAEKGIGYELLVAEMDFEEPGAALVISIALNKKNEAAMETAHTGVMKPGIRQKQYASGGAWQEAGPYPRGGGGASSSWSWEGARWQSWRQGNAGWHYQ